MVYKFSSRLALVVFVCGAVVMMYELAGSRILAPYLGTTLYVWTSLIGTILASLSIGYWYGGHLADRMASARLLSLILMIAALYITIATFLQYSIVETIAQAIFDKRIAAIMSVLALFSPTTILLGMVSPLAVKLKVETLATTGGTVGNLYALSTLGSIVGTFISGFFLMPILGSTMLMYVLAFILLLMAVIIALRDFLVIKVLAGLIMIGFSLITMVSLAQKREQGLIDIDTAYNKVWIVTSPITTSPRAVRELQMGIEHSSAMFLNSDELVYEYTRYYRLADVFLPSVQNALMIGGAGYSYPKEFLRRYPQATLDVVEIDPGITKIAQQFFNLKLDPRLTIIHEDGRVYMNKTNEQYDVIYGDAFNSSLVPFHLTTIEATKHIHRLLKPNGVAIVNVIGAIEGPHGKFVRAEYATYKRVFPRVYLFPVNAPTEGNTRQNIMLVAFKNAKGPAWETDNQELREYLNHQWKQSIAEDIPILTDDFAPVEEYQDRI